MIDNTNLFSEAYDEVETFLKGLSGLDPRNRDRANWIHASFPHINSKGFEGYPFIILRVDVNEENKSFDVVTSNKIFRVMIQIYSNEPTEIESISDKIFENFKGETNMTEFHAREMSSSPINWSLDINGKKVLFRNIGFIMRKRI